MSFTKFPTFTAGEALLHKRRVKIKAGTTSSPPQVAYADSGEQHIGVTGNYSTASGDPVALQPINATGTYEFTANEAFAVNATLYGGDSGTVQDSSSGSALALALEAATASGDIVECMPFGVLSTTAATVSYADGGEQTSAATVEAALAEVYTDILTAQAIIPLPLANFKETTNFDVGAIAANGGVLANDTTPILEAINAATDGCQRINWASGEVDQVTVQAIIPPDIDVTADIVFHCRIASESTTDAVGFTVDWFINEGDTKVVDTTTTNQTATYAEKIATLGNADIGSGAQTITIGLTPVAHTTDQMYFTAAWLEYTKILLTS